MHAEPTTLPHHSMLCPPSWPGRLFGASPVYLQDTHLSFDYRRHPHHLNINALTGLPTLQRRLTGMYWYLQSETHTFKLGPFQPASLTPIHKTVTQFLLEQAENRITATYNDFVRLARKNYLQDTHLQPLSRKVAVVSQFYMPLLDTHLSLSPATEKKLRALQAVTPLADFADRLRAQFEHDELTRYKRLFDQVEAHPLTHNQRLAVIRDDTHNLVLAAAGTGKTSVIVARVLYLLVSQRANADEIVVLAYNNAAASELRQRFELRNRQAQLRVTRLPKILTFHALARQLIAQTSTMPEVSPLAVKREHLEQWAQRWWQTYIGASAEQLKLFVQAMCLPVDPFQFKSAASLEAHYRDAQYRTLQGERVASYALWQLANFLFINGIAYRYRPALARDETSSHLSSYRPDFLLTDSQLLLDYIAVDGQGAHPIGSDIHHFTNHQRVLSNRFVTMDIHPPQPPSAGIKTVPPLPDTHADKVQRLRCFHADFTHHKVEQVLLRTLTRLGQPMTAPSLASLQQTVKASSGFGESVKRYLACLAALRAEQLNAQQARERIAQHLGTWSADFSTLLDAFCQAYKQRLKEDSHIDFDDMISQAADNISQPLPYRHILVDEFQDISNARLGLLSALRRNSQTPTLTAVGDDWQAIYRFSGGNLQLTTHFAEHIGPHSTTLLDKTFRYNNSIAHTAGQFVMQNPSQYQKAIETHQHTSRSKVFLLDDMPDQRPDPGRRACEVISQLRQRDPAAHVAVLARYHFHLRAVRQLLRQAGEPPVSTWTLHSAKGLEADHVVVIGLDNGPLGFPSAARQDQLTEALLPVAEPYPFAEERRLLYVAITRARRHCYLIANPLKPSIFVEELLNPAFAVEIVSERFHAQFRQTYKCPHCVYGYYLPDSFVRPARYTCSSAPACASQIQPCPQCGAPDTSDLCSACQCTPVVTLP